MFPNGPGIYNEFALLIVTISADATYKSLINLLLYLILRGVCLAKI